MPSDPMKHAHKGAIGALIIEPQGSTWVEDRKTRTAATVTTPTGESFRDLVLMFQDAINMVDKNGNPLPRSQAEEDEEDTGKEAFNYRAEPMWFRLGFSPAIPGIGAETNQFDYTNVLSNSLTGKDPVTPVFTAKAHQPVRFRVLHPGGKQRNHVFMVSGHNWQREPYTHSSRKIGTNPFSEWKGSQIGIGPSSHFDIVLSPKHGAGGKFGVKGDYLYRDVGSFTFMGGLWGLLRVE
jgi:hypothetical protein